MQRKKVTAAVTACILALSALCPMTALAQPGDLTDGQYTDVSGAPVEGVLAKGITVTKYQNRANENGIDWDKVAGDGVSFAMVRLGYLKDKDPYFDRNITEAAAHGLKTGVFFYTQALDTRTAVEEANYVLQVIKEFPVSYPVAYDVESQHLLDNGLTPAQITDNVNAFCSTIEAAGYRPIVYANHEWLTVHMEADRIPYDIWYARYGTVNHYKNRTIWQCSQDGTVDGIQGNVTIELAFTDYGAVIPAEGWKQIGGRWYYMKNYVKQTGWVQADGKWYYLDPGGAMISDTEIEIDGVSYRFGPDGAMI